MCRDNLYLSGILDRQGLLVAAPTHFRTKKAESFSPQLLQGFWSKLKKNNPKIVVMSPTVTAKNSEQKMTSSGNSTVCAWPWQQKILAASIFFFWDEDQERFGTANGPSCEAKSQVDFHNFGSLQRPLELVPALRERVVPTEWKVRTVLWRPYIQCISDFNSSATVSAICSDH